MPTKRKAPPHAFTKGTSGNPKGRPKGSRHKTTMMLQTLMEGDAAAIVQTVINQAKAGDMAAARVIIDRLLPPAKERPVSLALPDTATPKGIAAAQNAILQAVAGGELLPTEATTLAGIIEARRRAIETVELSDRITLLESKS